MASSIPVSVPADAAGLEAARGGRVARRTRQLVAAGAAFVALLTIMAVAAPWLAPHDPVRQSLRARLTAPTLEAADGRAHPLGTDHLGRDVLSRTIWGARVSLLVGFAAVMVGGLVGAGLGILAGYRGGWTDTIIMTMMALSMNTSMSMAMNIIITHHESRITGVTTRNTRTNTDIHTQIITITTSPSMSTDVISPKSRS